MHATETEVTSFQMLIRRKCQLRRQRYMVMEPTAIHVHKETIARSRSNMDLSMWLIGQSGARPQAIQAMVQKVRRCDMIPIAP